MSIKSEKSLLEECSEIIERSYSVRSASDESLSCDDEDECLARVLMNKMTPAVLSKLRRCFKKNKERNKAQDIDRRVEAVMRAAAAEEGIEFAETAPPPQDTLWLDERGFVTSLDTIFGHHKYTTHAHKLFQSLDSFSTGKVWWRQLINKLVAVGAKKTSTRAEVWTPLSEQDIKRLEHCKRETLVKLVCVERERSFCYVAVSRGGRVGVYSGDMRLLYSYEMFYHRSGLHGRVKNRWITDVIYLPDAQFLVMSASDRSLTMYDATTLSHTPLYCITGLPSIPTCLAYSASSHICETSQLAFGSDRGDVTIICFLQPKVQLFHTKTPDAINYYFWMELPSPPHSSYCSITRWRRVHARSVKRVAFSRGDVILVTCSHDAAVSMRIRHVPGKMDDYVFKVNRGVTCFHVVSALHLVATGGCDGAVRLWQPCARAPFATLVAPTSPAILDIAIVAAHELVIAFCNTCTVHIWDLYEECLLQTIKIKFPFLGVLGKKVEFGPYCIHPGPVRKEEEEEETILDEPIVMSRRASSVYQGSTGGLMLQLDNQNDWDKKGLEDEPEYRRYNRCSLLLSCCDCVCTLRLAPARGGVLAPPADTLCARRPSAWDLPDCLPPTATTGMCCDCVCTLRLAPARGGVLAPPADTLCARRPSAWDLPDCVPPTATTGMCCDCVCTLRLAPARGGVLAPPADTLCARRPSAWDLPDCLPPTATTGMCCDCVCTLRLAPARGGVLAPPADTLCARRPSAWDLPDCLPPTATTASSSAPHPRPSPVPTPQLLSPSSAAFPLTDLDTLLENAGLQGILEKDFVLMQGLKNDLNRKLAEMEANKQVMTNAVSAGAPYLALKTYDPTRVEPVDEMIDEYKRIMRLFPAASITGTPTGSEKSTPRNSRTHRS